MEVVVEEEDGKRNVRIAVDLKATVLANARRVAQRPRIGDTGMTASMGNIVGLLRRSNCCRLFVYVFV